LRNTALTCFEVFSFFFPHLNARTAFILDALKFIILKVLWNVCYKLIFKTTLALKSLFSVSKKGVRDLFAENENYFL